MSNTEMCRHHHWPSWECVQCAQEGAAGELAERDATIAELTAKRDAAVLQWTQIERILSDITIPGDDVRLRAIDGVIQASVERYVKRARELLRVERDRDALTAERAKLITAVETARRALDLYANEDTWDLTHEGYVYRGTPDEVKQAARDALAAIDMVRT